MGKVLLLTLCFILASQVSLASEEIDNLIDVLLDFVAVDTVNKQRNQVPLPNVNLGWDVDLWLFKLGMSLNCSGGQVRSLATVYRTGEADGEITPEGRVVIESPVGLRALVFNFDRCIFRIKDVFTKAAYDLEGLVKKNSLRIKADAQVDQAGVKVTVDSLRLEELSSIIITTGDNFIAKILDGMATAVINVFTGKIKDAANGGLKQVEGMHFYIDKLPLNDLRALIESNKLSPASRKILSKLT